MKLKEPFPPRGTGSLLCTVYRPGRGYEDGKARRMTLREIEREVRENGSTVSGPHESFAVFPGADGAPDVM